MHKYGIKDYDVVIVGAGPAGCTCALALKQSGLKIALVDKAKFPRKKVCGDLITGRAIKILNKLSPAYVEELKNTQNLLINRKTATYYKNKRLEFKWVNEACLCSRKDFDNFLLNLVKKNTNTDIYEGFNIDDIKNNNEKVCITADNDKIVINTKIIIGADGARSIVAKKLSNRLSEDKYKVDAVQVYFKNVKCSSDNTAEIYFDKKFLPGYFWLFALPDNIVNVGFGMLTKEIKHRKINIKEAFYSFINESEILKEKFKNSEQICEIEGARLPIGSKITNVSGERFLLTGDAASLIDPLNGEGIGNAMLSGKTAASQVVKSFENNDFSAGYHKNYDKELKKSIGKELQSRYKMMTLFLRIRIIPGLIFFLATNRYIRKRIQKFL
ncbi:geranylgeranyl reductase family protein [Bacteroidota bacterium]